MYDYIKIWVEDRAEIETIRNLPFLNFEHKVDTKTGELIFYPMDCKWKCFELTIISPTRIQIAGSLHKYYTGGDNAGEFTLENITDAINSLSQELNFSQQTALIKNLEVGVNICPDLNSSKIIEDILCFKNKRPNWPYNANDEGFYFIEFKSGDFYLKVYDKGKQYGIKNTLRIELKFMRSRELRAMGVNTLVDLKKKEVAQVLGWRIVQQSANIVFDDSEMRSDLMRPGEKWLYERMSNPKHWVHKRGKNSSHYRAEKKFVELVKRYGDSNHYHTVKMLVKNKVDELLKNEVCTEILSKYNRETLHHRYCISCGRSLHPGQKKGSKFCSAKYVGEKAAHKCRNKDSNRRNYLRRKISKQKAIQLQLSETLHT